MNVTIKFHSVIDIKEERERIMKRDKIFSHVIEAVAISEYRPRENKQGITS